MIIDEKKIAYKVSINSIIGNVVLSAFKLIAGVFGFSAAMISDGVHSLSDVFSTIIVMVGIRTANKKADADHQYGHERYESVTAILLSIVLCATAVGIGWSGINIIISGDYSHLRIPTLLPLIAAIVSILLKEGMYWYTLKASKKINSDALRADAWHHRSDALSSIGSFAGILAARLGFPIMDPIASILISIFIIRAGIMIFKDAIDKMTDKACDDETIAKIEKIINETEGVLSIDLLKTRLFGNKIYVDVEIGADGNMLLKDSHEIAHIVHDKIEEQVKDIKHCMVHVNPVNCARRK